MSMAERALSQHQPGRLLNVPPSWGTVIIGYPRPLPALGGVHAYDHRGRVLFWNPSPNEAHPDRRCACDVESSDAQVAYMGERWKQNKEDFLASWVCTETAAKLLRIPILAFLKEHGLVSPPPHSTPEIATLMGQQIEVLWSNELEWYFALGRTLQDPT